MNKFIEILERKMIEKGFNRRSLALACGMQEFAIQSIVAGKSINPRIDTMAKIADALECSIDELYGRNFITSTEVQNISLWTDSVERVELMIKESRKIIDTKTRATLYLACYEFNSQGVEIKDVNQLNTLIKFIKKTNQ